MLKIIFHDRSIISVIARNQIYSDLNFGSHHVVIFVALFIRVTNSFHQLHYSLPLLQILESSL